MLDRRVIEADNDPMGYPWQPPKRAGVMREHDVDALNLIAGRRISAARVISDGEANDTGARVRSIQRDCFEHQVAVPDQRYLVVAVGSNACLDVMRNKFRRRGVSTGMYMPFAPVRVHNLRVVHLAQAAARGYIPATAIHHEGHVALLWAAWLDQAQLRALDSTEPGYECRYLDAQDYPIEVLLDPGTPTPSERPEGFYLYEGTAGALRINGQVPDLMTQEELLALLVAREPFARLFACTDPTEVSRKLTDDATRNEFHETLAREGMIERPNLHAEAEVAIASRRTYSTVRDLSERMPIDGATFEVFPTRPLRRQGQPAIVVSTANAARLGSWAEAGAVCEDVPDGHPAVVVKVHAASDLDDDVVEMDQMVRDGLGVRLRETVTLRPATPASPVADIVASAIARPRYLLGRVQVADHCHAESDIALLDPQLMKMLGLEDGDVAVLEGRADAQGRVRRVRMVVCSASDAILERRRMLAGGDIHNPYCDADEALGIYPDLPWVFIDRDVRLHLGVGDAYLGLVRIRASRQQKLMSELRELMLVLAISLVGIVSLTDSTWLSLGMFGFVLFVTILLSVFKVRSRVGLRDGT